MFHVEQRRGPVFVRREKEDIAVAKVIVVVNQKGGVGKTTTSVNLSAALGISDHTVLLIDMDPQANATSGLGADPRTLPHTVYDCLMRGIKISEVVLPTAIPHLSLIPANTDLVGAEVELVSVPNREKVLKIALEDVQSQYDFVLVDCPPALGLLTINALVAASSVLIPVQCEYYAMEGLGRLMVTVKRIRESFNPSLELEGILLTMYDSRNSLSRQVSEEIREHFKGKVYRAVIPRNVTLAEAPSYGRPVMLYNAASVGSQAYLELAKECLTHGEKGPR